MFWTSLDTQTLQRCWAPTLKQITTTLYFEVFGRLLLLYQCFFWCYSSDFKSVGQWVYGGFTGSWAAKLQDALLRQVEQAGQADDLISSKTHVERPLQRTIFFWSVFFRVRLRLHGWGSNPKMPFWDDTTWNNHPIISYSRLEGRENTAILRNPAVFFGDGPSFCVS